VTSGDSSSHDMMDVAENESKTRPDWSGRRRKIIVYKVTTKIAELPHANWL